MEGAEIAHPTLAELATLQAVAPLACRLAALRRSNSPSLLVRWRRWGNLRCRLKSSIFIRRTRQLWKSRRLCREPSSKRSSVFCQRFQRLRSSTHCREFMRREPLSKKCGLLCRQFQRSFRRPKWGFLQSLALRAFFLRVSWACGALSFTGRPLVPRLILGPNVPMRLPHNRSRFAGQPLVQRLILGPSVPMRLPQHRSRLGVLASGWAAGWRSQLPYNAQRLGRKRHHSAPSRFMCNGAHHTYDKACACECMSFYAQCHTHGCVCMGMGMVGVYYTTCVYGVIPYDRCDVL